MPNPTATAEFKGFADWVELFRTGIHTDAHGNKRPWVASDLDELVANHSASDPAPLVIGHPEVGAPAYGWSAELKRDGETLLGKFSQVHSAVDDAAKAGSYRNRSIKVSKTDAGWKLVHVGLLGATPPAIPGLAPVYSASADGDVYEFAVPGGQSYIWGLRGIARAYRALREWIVAERGVEEADKALPQWPIEDMERAAAQAEAEAAPHAFSSPEPDMPYSQQQLDAAIAAAVAQEQAKTTAAEARAQTLEFGQRLQGNQTFVSGLISDTSGAVRLTPAEAAGWAEALTYAQGMESAEFEFSADGQAQKPKLYEFLRAKLEALQPRLQLGREHAVTDPPAVDIKDPVALAAAAQEFQAAEAAKGHTINIGHAVEHIKSTRAAATK